MQDIIFYKKTEPESLRKRAGETLDEALDRAGERLKREREAFVGPKIPRPTHVESVVRAAIFSNRYIEMREMLKNYPKNAQAFSDFEQKRGFWANRSFEQPGETRARERLTGVREVSARPLVHWPS